MRKKILAGMLVALMAVSMLAYRMFGQTGQCKEQ